MTPRALLTILCFVGALGQPPALAQEPQFAERAETDRALEVVGARDREAIHPGDPLRLVGLAEDGNDFRGRLHALHRGDFEPTPVDERDAYQRQLAMLEGSLRPDRPYFAAPGSPERAVKPAARTARAGADAGAERPDRRDTTWIGIVLAAVAATAFMVTHCRDRVSL